LTKNWSAFFKKNFLPPESVMEAVHRLMMILDGEQKTSLTMMQEKDLIDLPALVWPFGMLLDCMNRGVDC